MSEVPLHPEMRAILRKGGGSVHCCLCGENVLEKGVPACVCVGWGGQDGFARVCVSRWCGVVEVAVQARRHSGGGHFHGCGFAKPWGYNPV